MDSKEINFYHDTISSFEELFSGENITDSLNFYKIIDGVSSIPMYERLGIDKELFTCNEQQQMDLEAKMFKTKYQEKLNRTKLNNEKETKPQCLSIINDTFLEERDCNSKNLNICVTCDDKLDETLNSEDFLNFIYCIDGKDYPISTFQNNINFDISFSNHKELEPVQEINKGIPKDFKDFLQDISYEKYEQYAFRINSSEDSPSSSCSDDEEVIPPKVKELSNQLNMGSNADKYSFMKKIIEDSMKQTVMPEKSKLLLISSDSDSEQESFIEKRVQQTATGSKKGRKSKIVDKKISQTKKEVQMTCSTNKSKPIVQNIRKRQSKTNNQEKTSDISASISDPSCSSKCTKQDTKLTSVGSSKILHTPLKTSNIDVTEKATDKNVNIVKQRLDSKSKIVKQKQANIEKTESESHKDPQHKSNPSAVSLIPTSKITKPQPKPVNKTSPIHINTSSDSDEDMSALITKRLTVVDKIVTKKSKK